MADDGTDATTGQAPNDAKTTAPVDGTPTTTTSDTTATQGQEPDAEPFDRDRAMATIRKLREEAKQAARALKDLDTLRAERKAAEEAKLSDEQRLTKRAADLEAELTQERLIARDRSNRYEVQILAGKLGIVDPDAAVKLLDWSSLDYADDGRPTDVEQALADLVADKPYLKAAAATQQPNAQRVSPTNPASRTPAADQRRYSSAELADRDFYLKHRDDIVLAMRQGRIDP